MPTSLRGLEVLDHVFRSSQVFQSGLPTYLRDWAVYVEGVGQHVASFVLIVPTVL